MDDYGIITTDWEFSAKFQERVCCFEKHLINYRRVMVVGGETIVLNCQVKSVL